MTDQQVSPDHNTHNIGFGLDRLETMRMEQNTSAFNAAMLDSLMFGVIIVRFPERIIERNNARMLELVGASSMQQLIGRHISGFYCDDDTYQKVGALADQVLRDGYGTLRDVMCRRLDGTFIYMDLFGRHFQETDGIQRIMLTFADVTEDPAHQALFDELTNLPNQRALGVEISKAMLRAQRHKKLLGVVMMNLDDFKSINEMYGHDVGDRVLRTMGRRLQSSLRRTDFVACLGGDEFVLLIEDVPDFNEISLVLDKIRQAMHKPIALRGGSVVSVGFSAGVCVYPTVDTDNPDALLRYADMGLYESKAHKTDREHPWVFFGENIRTAQHATAQDLLEAGALEIWYQPILNNRTRKVVGVEALARLRDAEGKIWFPAEFLPQLQDADLFDLSKKVLAQVLVDLPILDAQGQRSLWVSVNIDPRSISEACTACLREMLILSTVDPSRITLEILEGSDFLEQQATLEHLLEMKALGVRLALDDVGSAYASLLRLKDLPIDGIKLDQAFIRTLEKRPYDLHFVGAIQDLASGMGVDLVVEGVDTDDTFDAITVMGAPLLQGYAIAKPLPLAELQEFLQHTPSHYRRHPIGLLGLYAAQLTNRRVLEKMIRQNIHLVNNMMLADATICPIHDDIRRLGVDGGSLIDQRHQEYHLAIAAMAALPISSPASDDWGAIERAGDAFENAIMEVFWKNKTEDSSQLSLNE